MNNMNMKEKVKEISCGWSHSMFLT